MLSKKYPLPKSVRQHYKVTEKRAEYILECKECPSRFSLKPGPGGISGGTVLALLNHAYSHFVMEEDD